MGKNRKNPNKPQNKYRGDCECKCFEKNIYGREWCHDEGYSGWNEWVRWSQTDEDGRLKCKGNRHKCFKMKLKWFASLSEKEKKKYINDM